MLAPYTILIIDDEDFVRSFCYELLTMEGYQAKVAATSHEALDMLTQEVFDIALLDLNMPDLDGLKLLQNIADRYAHISPIIMTGYATLEAAVTAQDLGAEGFILKPFNDHRLLRIIEKVAERRSLRQDYARLQAHVPLLAMGHRLMSEPDLEKLALAVLEIIQHELGVAGAAMWLPATLQSRKQWPNASFSQLAQLGKSLPAPPNSSRMLSWVTLGPDNQPISELNQAQTLHFLLKTEEHPIGWLSLTHDHKGQFSKRDLEFLAVISSHLAVGLENRQLYRTMDLARREWEAIFDTIQDAIIVHDVNGRITRINRTIINWLSTTFSDLAGLFATDIKVNPEGHSLCDISGDFMNDSKPNTLDNQTVEFHSPPWAVGRSFRVKTFPLYRQDELMEIIHVLEDITQASRIQAQMVQTEKLSALGRLSASLAHEINNPLQALRSGLRLLSRPKLTDEKRKQYVAMLVKEVERLVTITTQTLDFARPNRVGKQETNLNDLLQDTMQLVSKQLERHQITTTMNLANQLPPIQIVPEQIKQVFINLILNGVDAMSEESTSKERQLKIATCHSLSRQCVVTSVIDNGPGIPPEIMERISEPFFTTKEAGTGLGLAISYSIIEAHGGYIEIINRPEGGCCFSVYLPIKLEQEYGFVENK